MERLSQQPTGDKQGHVPALDGIRGLAVLLVLLFHCCLYGPFVPVFSIGWTGVDLFFVLSGFLITGILLDTRGQEGYFKRFIVRRVLRVFPLYYATLAFVFLLDTWHPMDAVQGLAARQAWFWCYVPNLLFAFHGWQEPGKVLNHFWSLAIEEQFYLIWPWVVGLCGRRTLVWTMVLGIATSVALRAAYPVAPFSYTFTLARIDGLLLGALLALGLRARPDLLRRWAMPTLLGGAVLLGIALLHGDASFNTNPRMLSLGIPGVNLLFCGTMALVVTGAAGGRVAALFTGRPLRFLGRYSYGLYVFHWPLRELAFFPLLTRLKAWGLSDDGALGAALFLFFVLLFGLTIASYELVERRILALKDRLVPYARKTALADGSGQRSGGGQ